MPEHKVQVHSDRLLMNSNSDPDQIDPKPFSVTFRLSQIEYSVREPASSTLVLHVVSWCVFLPSHHPLFFSVLCPLWFSCLFVCSLGSMPGLLSADPVTQARPSPLQGVLRLHFVKCVLASVWLRESCVIHVAMSDSCQLGVNHGHITLISHRDI